MQMKWKTLELQTNNINRDTIDFKSDIISLAAADTK
jgi:hypothetical protein